MKTETIEFTRETRTHPADFTIINPASIAGLDACIEDARLAALDMDPGPAEPRAYQPLLARLEAVRTKLPPLYRESMVAPFIKTLRELGEEDFKLILLGDPMGEGAAGLMLDIAQALLQQGEGFAELPTDAFEEVVSDLYDGFLSAEDRQGVNPPDLGVIPPLVKWGNPDFGPYTWPINATSVFGCQAAVVNLPPANAKRGLVAWSALGHETAGHDIIHADTGLQAELAAALQQSLRSLDHDLDQYWSARIDETASDVMGILNVGPATGIGLIAYFRALNAAFTGEARLRSEVAEHDPHPADVLRGYLAAETVALLKFTGREEWSHIIADETDKDVQSIVLAGERVSKDLARQSAKIVAQTLVSYRAKALENHALGEIQNWRDLDERKVQLLRAALRDSGELPSSTDSPIYAAHAIAATVTEALADGGRIQSHFRGMIAMLNTMHDQNPSWGPLFVAHPGNITRGRVYCRSSAAPREREAPLAPRASPKITRRQKSVPRIKLSATRLRD